MQIFICTSVQVYYLFLWHKDNSPWLDQKCYPLNISKVIPTWNHCAVAYCTAWHLLRALSTLFVHCAGGVNTQWGILTEGGLKGRKNAELWNWELWNFRPNNDRQMRRGDKFRRLIVPWMPPDWQQQQSSCDFWPLCNHSEDNAGMVSWPDVLGGSLRNVMMPCLT